MSRLFVLQTGSTLVSPAVPNRDAVKWKNAYTGLFQKRSSRISVPVKCFAVETKDRTVLFDTGWSALDATEPRRHLGFGLSFASWPVLTPEESASAQLKRLGLKPDAIAMTHLDCDHISGIDAFVGKQPVYVSEQELKGAAKDKVRYREKLWKGVSLITIDFKEDMNAPLGLSADIFGDGSVTAYLVPGHSPGSVVYIVRDGDRYAVITGDTGYNQKSWEELRMPGIVYDEQHLETGLQWIRSMLDDPACMGVFAAHDPAVKPGEYSFGDRVQDAQGVLV